jgi:hypothetical protein
MFHWTAIAHDGVGDIIAVRSVTIAVVSGWARWTGRFALPPTPNWLR